MMTMRRKMTVTMKVQMKMATMMVMPLVVVVVVRRRKVSSCNTFITSIIPLSFLSPTPSTLSVEEQQKDEGMDVKVVLLIREEILPFSSSVPEHFTARIMALLNRGSIHSASTASFLGEIVNHYTQHTPYMHLVKTTTFTFT